LGAKALPTTMSTLPSKSTSPTTIERVSYASSDGAPMTV